MIASAFGSVPRTHAASASSPFLPELELPDGVGPGWKIAFMPSPAMTRPLGKRSTSEMRPQTGSSIGNVTPHGHGSRFHRARSPSR